MCAALAQLVEQGTENPCVLGSIPRRGTTFLTGGSLFFDVSESHPWFSPSRKTIHWIVLLGRVRRGTTFLTGGSLFFDVSESNPWFSPSRKTIHWIVLLGRVRRGTTFLTERLALFFSTKM